jgi:hypothetical protein
MARLGRPRRKCGRGPGAAVSRSLSDSLSVGPRNPGDQPPPREHLDPVGPRSASCSSSPSVWASEPLCRNGEPPAAGPRSNGQPRALGYRRWSPGSASWSCGARLAGFHGGGGPVTSDSRRDGSGPAAAVGHRADGPGDAGLSARLAAEAIARLVPCPASTAYAHRERPARSLPPEPRPAGNPRSYRAPAWTPLMGCGGPRRSGAGLRAFRFRRFPGARRSRPCVYRRRASGVGVGGDMRRTGEVCRRARCLPAACGLPAGSMGVWPVGWFL